MNNRGYCNIRNMKDMFIVNRLKKINRGISKPCLIYELICDKVLVCEENDVLVNMVRGTDCCMFRSICNYIDVLR